MAGTSVGGAVLIPISNPVLQNREDDVRRAVSERDQPPGVLLAALASLCMAPNFLIFVMATVCHRHRVRLVDLSRELGRSSPYLRLRPGG